MNQPPNAEAAPAGTPGVGARRLDALLLVAALVAAVALALLDVDAPWENGFKGTNGSAYTQRFLQHHLELGLSATRGASIKAIDPRTQELVPYLNHPATYQLVQLAAAALFGLSEATVRIVALLLYLPAVPAMWWLARRLLGPPAAGACALLFATTPMVAYFGPMAVPDGPLLAAFPLVAAAFLAHVERPTRATRRLLGGAFLAACLMDWEAAFFAPVLVLLVPATADRPRAWRLLLRLAPVAALAVVLLFAHTALIVGGPRAAARQWFDLSVWALGTPTSWSAVLAEVGRDARTFVGPLRLGLVGAGLVVALCARVGRPVLRRAAGVGLVLLLPGLLNVAGAPAHALVHDYWSMLALPGLSLLAVLPLAAVQRATRAPARLAASALGAVIVAASCAGAFETVIRARALSTTLFRDVGERLGRWFGPGDVVVSSVPLTNADVYAQATLVGPITTPEEAWQLAADYAPPAFDGQLAFLLPRRERDTPLGRALERMAAPQLLPHALLFRVRR